MAACGIGLPSSPSCPTLSPTSSSASVSLRLPVSALGLGSRLGQTLLVTSAMRCTLAPPRNVLQGPR
jgi:hypothetical protein